MTDERDTRKDGKPLNPFLQQVVQSLAEGARVLTSLIREVIQDDQFQQFIRAINAGVEAMEFWDWVEKACAQSGFLPYQTVPFVEFYRECEGNYERFFCRVSNYYKCRQEDILQDIESRLETSKVVDGDRKGALQEAIVAHRHGLFRLPARALLPDIERTILEDWMGRERGQIEKLSDRQVAMVVKNKSLEDVTPGSFYDYRLFGCLVNVLYKNGNNLKEFEGESLPNRHAALHGWLSYSTNEYSLNTIIFTDYILRLIPAFKNNED